jgi:SPP1 family predicted phage head-tail adaptor
MALKAGDLDRRITIQLAVKTPDASGEPIEVWSDLATVWAEVVPLGGREFFEARQVNAEQTTRFRIRYRADITREMRVIYPIPDGDTYGIEAAEEDRRFARREALLITALARVA